MPEPAVWGERHETALAHAWSAYRSWAAVARSRKREITSWRRRVLWLTVGGAVLGALATLTAAADAESLPARILAGAAGVLVALAGFFTKEILSPEREHRWVRARAAAERTKSDAFLFRSGVAPFDTDDAPAVLMDRLIEQEADAPPVSPPAAAKDPPSTPLSTEGYVRDRVDDQVAFYARKADEHERAVERGRLASLALGVAAIVLGAFGEAVWAGAMIAVITTATASVATYLYANGFKDLLVSYRAAGAELAALRRRWDVEADPDEAQRDAFIAACEAVLMEENGGWMARRLERPTTPDAAID